MNVAITGASGFIGQHVLSELESQSVECMALIRPNKTEKFKNYGHKVVQFDIHNAPANAFELMGKPDVLIHLAWANVPQCESLNHFENELPAQYTFLKMLIKSGLKNLVVAGTCLEYGMQAGSLKESLFPRPTSPYGFAKNALRCQLEYLQATSSFNLTWARLFYLFGEGQSENSLLPQIKCAIHRGDEIFNMSGGEQLRDYLPVSIVAKHLVSLAMTGENIGVVNVCSGNPISIRKLVDGWIKENQWSIKLNLGYYPYRDYEPMEFWGDPNKLLSITKKYN
jgi:nucleoside-diphosphate-sugar epimerase